MKGQNCIHSYLTHLFELFIDETYAEVESQWNNSCLFISTQSIPLHWREWKLSSFRDARNHILLEAVHLKNNKIVYFHDIISKCCNKGMKLQLSELQESRVWSSWLVNISQHQWLICNRHDLKSLPLSNQSWL